MFLGFALTLLVCNKCITKGLDLLSFWSPGDLHLNLHNSTNETVSEMQFPTQV